MLEKADPNLSFEIFDNKINELMNKCISLKKITKKDFKLQQKPWITLGLRNSIKRRDKILRTFIKGEVIK